MDTIQPSEKAMKNLYKFLGRVLPKYIDEINKLNKQKERESTIKRAVKSGTYKSNE
ncbi:hypothetical protein J42TS3_42470 [Paenibacillus vini]|uniref:Uncharacterized protein n=1 Tax=Paenibacillus vini TaxID=1476024 RepID=A0ABQ4MHU8_9BACL|nr:hypothetical protein J42TS3_42470 [Paenibacillus vini]